MPFELAQDLNGEWSFAEGDQRHRMVLNGIWQVGHGFQVSGIHYTSAGDRSATSYGGDLRVLGAGSVERQRLRPDGTIVPRNDFTQPARNRTNVRVQQRVALPNRVSIDVMAEAFNVFNHGELHHQRDGKQRAVPEGHIRREPDDAVRLPGHVLS